MQVNTLGALFFFFYLFNFCIYSIIHLAAAFQSNHFPLKKEFCPQETALIAAALQRLVYISWALYCSCNLWGQNSWVLKVVSSWKEFKSNKSNNDNLGEGSFAAPYFFYSPPSISDQVYSLIKRRFLSVRASVRKREVVCKGSQGYGWFPAALCARLHCVFFFLKIQRVRKWQANS